MLHSLCCSSICSCWPRITTSHSPVFFLQLVFHQHAHHDNFCNLSHSFAHVAVCRRTKKRKSKQLDGHSTLLYSTNFDGCTVWVICCLNGISAMKYHSGRSKLRRGLHYLLWWWKVMKRNSRFLKTIRRAKRKKETEKEVSYVRNAKRPKDVGILQHHARLAPLGVFPISPLFFRRPNLHLISFCFVFFCCVFFSSSLLPKKYVHFESGQFCLAQK